MRRGLQRLSPRSGTVRQIRAWLGRVGRSKGTRSRFAERAARRELLAQTIATIRERNAKVPRAVLQREIAEALSAARAERRRARRLG